MDTQVTTHAESRSSRAMGDLVLAELFLVQATLESASVIREGFSDISRQIGGREDTGQASISRVLQRTRDGVLDSYSARFRYLRELLEKERRS